MNAAEPASTDPAPRPPTGDPALHTRGVVEQCDRDRLVLALPDTGYRLHLVPRPADAAHALVPGKPARGTLHAVARRVDLVHTGGRYVEPVVGRPRRVQGTVVAADRRHLAVRAAPGAVFLCSLAANQAPTDFQKGQLVSFDIERGATFTPAAAPHRTSPQPPHQA